MEDLGGLFWLALFSANQLLGLTGATSCTAENGCLNENDDGLQYVALKDLLLTLEADKPKIPVPDVAGTSEATAVEPWPYVYRLPETDHLIRAQIQACDTKEQACRLKCSTTICNGFLRPIVEDVKRYTGVDW